MPNKCKYCHKTHTEMTRVYTKLLAIFRKDLVMTTDPARKKRLRHGIDTAITYLNAGQQPCRYAARTA